MYFILAETLLIAKPQWTGCYWWGLIILLFNPFQPVEINPDHTQGMRGRVLLDSYMEKVLSNKGTVKSPIARLPDIKQTFAIG